MTIKEFKKYIDKAYEKGKNNRVEFWLQLEDEEIECNLEHIGQFSICPDMTITIKPYDDTKIYSRELTKEQLNFKKQRDVAIDKLERIEEVIKE